ncbi:MAG: acetyl-CoA carboxylase biotin carboxyl carrier protein [Bdellovibrionia bacterium]
MAKKKSSHSPKVKREHHPEIHHSLSLTQLEGLVELMGKNEIAELEWEKNGERLKLRSRHALTQTLVTEEAAIYRPQAHVAAPVLPSLPALASQAGSSESKASDPKTASGSGKQILSPFVGTFYRAPSPDADPYIREGQSVKRGDVLCIIEAMKLMNEIEAEFAGQIKSVLVENGQPVEFGEPLFILEP